MSKLKFADAWSNLEYGYNTLKIITILCLIVINIMGMVLGIKLREKPFIVAVVDGRPESVPVDVLKITPEWVKNFGSFIITEYGNWGYNNYRLRMENIKNYISEELYLKLNRSFKDVEKTIVDNKILNTFKIKSLKIINPGSPYIIEISGENQMTGEGINKVEDIKYRLSIEKVKFSGKNPWGLEVKDIREVKQ